MVANHTTFMKSTNETLMRQHHMADYNLYGSFYITKKNTHTQNSNFKQSREK